MLDSQTGLPTVEVKIGESLVDALIKIGFARSKREARYFITAGAIRLGCVRSTESERPPHRQVIGEEWNP
jgi:tyrosyl-tRNA synthetase